MRTRTRFGKLIDLVRHYQRLRGHLHIHEQFGAGACMNSEHPVVLGVERLMAL